MPGPGPQDVEGLAVGDRHEPGPDVAVGTQPRVGAQRREERLGGGVLRVVGLQQRAADPQDDSAVLGDDVLEGRQAHDGSTSHVRAP